MSKTRLTSCGLALLSAVALAGCGGGTTKGASSPEGAVRSFLNGVGSGDGTKACSVLSKSLKQQALSAARSQGVSASNCAKLFDQAKAHLTAAQQKEFATARITEVHKSGSSATVDVAGAGVHPIVTLTGGRWYITGGIQF